VSELERPSLVGRWQVEDIGGAGVLDGGVPIVEFGTDGSLVASTGLNRIRGTYEVAGGALLTSPLATTRMAGPPAVMHQEQRLVAALEAGGPIVERAPFVHIGDGATSLRLIRAGQEIVVRVDVLYRERMMLPAGAVVTARVSDVSRMDAAAIVLAEATMTPTTAPPYGFELAVDPSRFDDRAQLSASARIEVDGELLFVSDTMCPVITNGAPTEVEVTVVRAGPTP